MEPVRNVAGALALHFDLLAHRQQPVARCVFRSLHAVALQRAHEQQSFLAGRRAPSHRHTAVTQPQRLRCHPFDQRALLVTQTFPWARVGLVRDDDRRLVCEQGL